MIFLNLTQGSWLCHKLWNGIFSSCYRHVLTNFVQFGKDLINSSSLYFVMAKLIMNWTHGQPHQESLSVLINFFAIWKTFNKPFITFWSWKCVGNHIMNLSVYSGSLPQTITVNKPACIGVEAGKFLGVRKIFSKKNVFATSFLIIFL